MRGRWLMFVLLPDEWVAVQDLTDNISHQVSIEAINATSNEVIYPILIKRITTQEYEFACERLLLTPPSLIA